MFYADLHIHSRYSRGTSKNLTVEEIGRWASLKGISVVGTGDITHPAWFKELKEKLIEDGTGLYSLRGFSVKFMLTGEISTIFRKDNLTRKVHHIVCLGDFEVADRFIKKLSRIGNLSSDGRPILGISSRNLLEILLECGGDSFIIPAHIWTPWFSLFGSRSGFDSVEECYEDLSTHIFALETGLSSDPSMNWMVSQLDRFRLISSSDAHSGEKIGRECCIFNCSKNFREIRNALERGEGYVGTVEFFPEEGKYHLDGHRKCGVSLTPEESLSLNCKCPKCGEPLTLGVLHRVRELADREKPIIPPTGGKVLYLVPLLEILSEIFETKSPSSMVRKEYDKVIKKIGPELFILQEASLSDIGKISSPFLEEAIRRVREGRVIKKGGYDGEYGIIRVFEEGELKKMKGMNLLFTDSIRKEEKEKIFEEHREEGLEEIKVQRKSENFEVNEEQKKAIELLEHPVVVIAGPGSGKTFILTSRILYLIKDRGIPPENILALTFSRRARDEIFHRLKKNTENCAEKVHIHTFHSLCLKILKEQKEKVNSGENFSLAGDVEKIEILSSMKEKPHGDLKKLLLKLSMIKRGLKKPEGAWKDFVSKYEKIIKEKGLIDIDDIIPKTLSLLKSEKEILEHYRKIFRWILVDEYQDVDSDQHTLIKLLSPDGKGIFIIGDPNQSIYSFRGASPEFLKNFEKEYPHVVKITLKKNYRSSPSLQVAGACFLGEIPEGRHEGKDILLSVLGSEIDEAEFIVKTIEELMEGHTFLSIESGKAEGKKGNYSFSDFAVLLRTELQSKPILESFRMSGIPHRYYSHNPIILREEVRKLVKMIRESPSDKIDRVFLEQILKEVNLPPDEPIALLILKTFENCRGNPDELVEEIYALSESDSYDPRADAVSIMTVHSAKGLEFRVVFIPGCEDGVFPLKFSKDEENLNEEKNLFYVALTRAKEKAILLRAKRRKWMGSYLNTSPSPFLQRIPGELIEEKTIPYKKKSTKKIKQMTLFQGN